MLEKKQKNLSQLKSNLSARDIEAPSVLPPIPDKRYFTISEAALLCEVKPHVLRYWEQEFLQLKPSKRRGNRRFYQHKDLMMIRRIRELLYDSGFTIEGAKSQLLLPIKKENSSIESDLVVKKIIADLETVLQNLKTSMEATV